MAELIPNYRPADSAHDELLWLALRYLGSRFGRPAAVETWRRLATDAELTASEKVELLVGLLIRSGVSERKVRAHVQRQRQLVSSDAGARSLRARVTNLRRQRLQPGWRPLIPTHRRT